MTNQRIKAGVGVAVVALATGAVGLGLTGSGATASPAVSHAKVHTQTFISHDVKQYQLGKNGSYVDFSKDVKHGTVLGADSTSGRYHAKTQVVTGDVSILRKGGLMTGRFALDLHTYQLSGKILNGVGKFKGVTGTITGRGLSENDTRVRISYHH